MTARMRPQTNAIAAAEYLAPDVPRELPWHSVPLVRATAESLKGYGRLVDDRRDYPIEIVTWPVAGWRQCDPGTGNEGGTTHGQFDFWWEGDVLYGKNQAVGSQYLLGWSQNPGAANPSGAAQHSRVLLWHANYHPDGGHGLYIHPNVWHEAVFPLAARASFYDEQGKVHARVSCNIAAEFGVFLAVPLAAPA